MIRENAYRSHFERHKAEVELASKLDEIFDVTHASTHGDYSLWVCEAKSNARDRFGLMSEVLAVYSRHTKSDARALTTIEHVSKRHPDYKQRVDRLVYLFVHEGDAEEARELAKRDLDRIIVPIPAAELRDPARGSHYLRSKLAQVTGEIDLFGVSSPISHDRHFYGREELVKSLLVKLGSSGENVGLFGLRKTGKTSVMKAVLRKAEEQPWLIEYIDCHNPGVHASRWWALLREICGRLAKRAPAISDLFLSRAFSESSAGLDFRAIIEGLLELDGIERVILLLDEIEYVTPGLAGMLGRHWDVDFVPFWQTVRSAHQEFDKKLTFLVAGVNPICVSEPRIADVPNPIFQLAQPEFLKPFERSQVREMIRTVGKYSGIRFDEAVYEWLTNTYGGHPYLIRLACSEVRTRLSRASAEMLATASVDDFHTAALEIRARLEQPIKDILLSLVWWYPEEYDVLRILASGDSLFVEDYLHQSEDARSKFLRYGLLAENDVGRFAIADLKDFLHEHGERYKKEISPFIRSDLPPELLPEVPDLAALGQLFALKSELEVLLRKVILLYLGVKCSFANEKIAGLIQKSLKRKDSLDLFTGRPPQDAVQELFTKDLRDVVTGNWETFAPLFDGNKARFEMNMDTVNKARRVDGHTKPIPHGEIVDFKNSYEWLLVRLRKVPG